MDDGGEVDRRADPGLVLVEQLCATAVDALGASRVLAWRYVPASRMVSPIAGAVAGERSFSLRNLACRWSHKSVEDISPFEQSLRLRRSVVAATTDLRAEVPAFARELVAESVWCEPVVVGEPVGILTLEPAPARSAALAVKRIATTVGALLTREVSERGRAQAELLLELIEAASAHTGSLGELLAMVGERLAARVGMTRASIFMSVGGQLVPRMSSYADGRHDADAWARFRVASEPWAIVEAAFTSQRPVMAVDRQDPGMSSWWTDHFGMQAALAVPLGHARSPIGVLVLDSTTPRTFRRDDVRLVAAAGALLGEIVHRFLDAEERESRLAAGDSVRELLKLGLDSSDTADMTNRLATIARQAMGTETAVVCLPDGTGRLLEVTRATATARNGDMPSPRALSCPTLLGAPIALTDVENSDGEHERLLRELGLRSGTLIPLAGQAAARGVLICGDTAPRRWSQRRLELASQLGLEGGLVLEATRLRETDRARRAELVHLAHHDSLTGLGNRGFFHERVTEALGAAAGEGRKVAVLLIDLDRFKEINDSLGHHEGDRLLVAVAQRISASLREGDVAARLGGDEFAVALTGRVNVRSMAAAARRLARALSEQVKLDGVSISIGASIGVAVSPDHGDDTAALLGHADAAMYEAKRGHSSVHVYEGEHEGHQPMALAATRLRRAIAERQLVPYYQPKIEVVTGRVVGVEALARWLQPSGEVIGPAEFIPLAETTGLIREISSLMIASALKQCQRWRAEGLSVDVAVNVAAEDICNSRLPRLVAAALHRAGVDAERLTIELTENSLVPNARLATAVLRELRELGVRISLDDFGTGYSSLALLERLPVTELKIDRCFIHEDGGETPGTILRSIVSLGRELGLTLVAEGVETESALQALANIGCDQAQGYYFCAPLPAEDFPAWMRDRTQPRLVDREPALA